MQVPSNSSQLNVFETRSVEPWLLLLPFTQLFPPSQLSVKPVRYTLHVVFTVHVLKMLASLSLTGFVSHWLSTGLKLSIGNYVTVQNWTLVYQTCLQWSKWPNKAGVQFGRLKILSVNLFPPPNIESWAIRAGRVSVRFYGTCCNLSTSLKYFTILFSFYLYFFFILSLFSFISIRKWIFPQLHVGGKTDQNKFSRF